MSIFTTRVPTIKTEEAKKITRVAKRVSSSRRNMMKPGPVTVTVYKPSTVVASK